MNNSRRNYMAESSIPAISSNPAPSSRFQPSQAYLEKSNSSSSTSTSNPVSIPASTSNKSRSAASWILEEEDDDDDNTDHVEPIIKKVEVESFLQTILREDSPDLDKDFSESIESTSGVGSVHDASATELDVDGVPLVLDTYSHSQIKQEGNSELEVIDYGITRKHPRASTSKSQIEVQDEEDQQSISTDSNYHINSHYPLNAAGILDPDQSYDSDLESIQSEGLIQAQLVGSRSNEHSLYTEDMDISYDDQMNYAEDSEGQQSHRSYGSEMHDDEGGENSMHLNHSFQNDQEGSPLLSSHTHDESMLRKRSREELNQNISNTEEDCDDEEEGEIREDANDLDQFNQFVSNDHQLSESISANQYASSSNARYSKSRRLDSQDSAFGNRTDFTPTYSQSHHNPIHSNNNYNSKPNQYSNNSSNSYQHDSLPLQSLTVSNSAELLKVENSDYPSSVETISKPLEKASYTRRSDLVIPPVLIHKPVATTFVPSPLQIANAGENFDTATEISAVKVANNNPSGSQQPTSTPQIQVKKETKAVVEHILPMSQSDRFKSLPLKLALAFPDMLTLESASSPLIFTQPFRSADAPTYIPDETVLHGYWPGPTTINSKKGVFPLPTPTSSPQVEVKEDNRGRVDVFIDNSNVLYSFLNWVRNRPESIVTVTTSGGGNSVDRVKTAKTVTLQGKKVKMDYKILLGILERGRKVEKRVLVGSSPLWQSLETTTKWGYEVSLLQRVARPLDPPPQSRTTSLRNNTSNNSSVIDRRFIPNNTTSIESSPNPNISTAIEVPSSLKREQSLPRESYSNTNHISIQESFPSPSSIPLTLPLDTSQSLSTSQPPLPPISRFTPRGAAVVLPEAVIDPITGLSFIPAVVVPRKKTRGIKKNKATKLALAAEREAIRLANERNGYNRYSNGGEQNKVGFSHTSNVNRNMMPVQQIRPVPTLPSQHEQLQIKQEQQQIQQRQIQQQQQQQFQEQRQQQLIQQQQEQLQLQFKQSQHAAMSGIIVPKHFREQAVDEVLHLKILESLLDFVPTSTSPRPLLVVATGDANSSEYNPSGFLGCIRRALDRGWNVEIVAFRDGTSSSWLVEERNASLAKLIEQQKQEEEEGAEGGEGKKSLPNCGLGRGTLRVVDLAAFAAELVTI